MKTLSIYMLPKKSLIIALLLLLLFSGLFWYFPDWDLQASQALYSKAGFIWQHSAWSMAVRHALYWVVRILMGACVLVLIAWCCGLRKLPAKAALFLVLSFALAPGLLVNGVLKDHWGRARPVQVQQFGGTQTFTPAWVISDGCRRNCSFTCGDASVAFAFWAFLPLVYRRRYRTTIGVGVGALGLFIGLVRMAQGGHFLSDVLLSGVLVYVVIWLLAWVFVSAFPIAKSADTNG